MEGGGAWEGDGRSKRRARTEEQGKEGKGRQGTRTNSDMFKEGAKGWLVTGGPPGLGGSPEEIEGQEGSAWRGNQERACGRNPYRRY